MIRTFAWLRRSLIWMTIPLVFLGGCGPKHPTVEPVSGKVTFKGEAVEGATVTFFAEGSGGHPAVGTTGADGTFNLTSYEPNDGAPAGKHTVTVAKIESSGPSIPAGESMEAAAARSAKGDTSNQEKMLLPAHYASASTSKLSFTVNKGEKNHFDIELKE